MLAFLKTAMDREVEEREKANLCHDNPPSLRIERARERVRERLGSRSLPLYSFFGFIMFLVQAPSRATTIVSPIPTATLRSR